MLCLLLFFLGTSIVPAQDTIFRLGPDQMEDGYLRFPPITGWKFNKGNDTAWASPGYDDSQWVKMDSAQVMSLRYDQQGVFEGWFRLKFQLEPGFEQLPTFLLSINTAATEVYLDGELVAQFGAIGDALEDYRSNRQTSDLIDVEPGRTYTMAVHFFDHMGKVTRFLQKDLKVLNIKSFLFLIPEATTGEREVTREKNLAYAQFTLGLTTVLCLLIWLIWALNRRHKHLLLLAILSTANTCMPLMNIFNWESYPRPGVLFNAEYNAFSLLVGVASGVTLTAVLPMLLSMLFTGVIPKWLRISGLFTIFVLAPFVILTYTFDGFGWVTYLPLLVIVLAAGLCIFYLIRYRKEIRGAKWAIVIGLIVCALLQAVVVIAGQAGLTDRETQNYLVYFYNILIPVSFVVYVAIWLRETQLSERKKALEVTRVSRENQRILKEQNRTLESEVKRRTQELRTSLENLRETQSQLVHAEKMASLGELTAGIAHEIKNPLNFVNNFAEVSKELLDEMVEELKNGDTGEVDAIATDLKQNLEKITHHGQRADSIVRGMLQHSRSGDGKKEPTNLGALADEYLRLAYHGLRAKDKSFNAVMETDFDPDLPEVNIIPQDIGRVLLNLITNAFHAVSERKEKNPEGYEPTVWVKTRKTDAGIELSVRDNGGGIPEAIREKIFQPFFTTKPTGEGTGLGLSMSYDIVTKGHGGRLTMKSKTGEGTEFLITLPE